MAVDPEHDTLHVRAIRQSGLDPEMNQCDLGLCGVANRERERAALALASHGDELKRLLDIALENVRGGWNGLAEHQIIRAQEVLRAARPTPPAPEGAGDALARYAEALLAHEVAEEAWRADVLDWPLKRAAWAAQRAEWDALKALQLAVLATRPTPRAAEGEG